MTVKNKVQLITYPDSLGGDLEALNRVLLEFFPDLFQGGVHILPPFPSSGDRGFAPLNYFEIDPKFGSWAEIRAISSHADVLLDLMVNHVSKESPYFQDFLKHGRSSQYADMFLTIDKIWDDSVPKEDDIAKIFLRRKVPYSEFVISDTGKTETVWTTFGKQTPSEQIDVDLSSDTVKKLFVDVLENFSKNGVRIVRLDAIGYITKKMGTSCFFVEPEIYSFIDWINGVASSFGLELLPEVHAHHSIQFKLSNHGCWIYDFILPYLVLDAIVNRYSRKLAEYLERRPQRQFTMLDCHDGIPVKPDMDGLVKTDDARKLVDHCMKMGANLSLIFSDKHKDPDGFDVHQIRCSYYSALGCDDDAYIAARAIQLFTPGIPQIYYVGLLAGENDYKGVEASKEGREINRHNFTIDEISQCAGKPVVQRLIRLIKFRNENPAFEGKFSVSSPSEKEIKLSWNNGGDFCSVLINMSDYSSQVECSSEGSIKESFKA